MSKEKEFIDEILKSGGYDGYITKDVARLVDEFLRFGVKLDERFALIDLMSWAHRGEVKPYRYYAKRWGWSYTTTYRFFASLGLTEQKWSRNGAKMDQERSGREAKKSESMRKSGIRGAEMEQEWSKNGADVEQEWSSIHKPQTTNLKQENSSSEAALKKREEEDLNSKNKTKPLAVGAAQTIVLESEFQHLKHKVFLEWWGKMLSALERRGVRLWPETVEAWLRQYAAMDVVPAAECCYKTAVTEEYAPGKPRTLPFVTRDPNWPKFNLFAESSPAKRNSAKTASLSEQVDRETAAKAVKQYEEWGIEPSDDLFEVWATALGGRDVVEELRRSVCSEKAQAEPDNQTTRPDRIPAHLVERFKDDIGKLAESGIGFEAFEEDALRWGTEIFGSKEKFSRHYESLIEERTAITEDIDA